MDKKTAYQMRRKQLRLKYGMFLRKNGLFVALGLCLAVIGGAAAAVFLSGGGESPAEHNYDQRLDEALNASTEPANTPISIVLPTLAPAAHATAVPLTPEPTLVPDITPAPYAPPTPTPEPALWSSPVEGEIIRVFAMDCLIYSKTLDQWMTHPGVDVAAPKGAEVRAVAGGTVERVYTDDMLGVTVVIKHENGMVTVYSNLKEAPPVSEGQRVESRAVIGCVGETAISECAEQSHLHFELYADGVPTDPTAYVLFKSTP